MKDTDELIPGLIGGLVLLASEFRRWRADEATDHDLVEAVGRVPVHMDRLTDSFAEEDLAEAPATACNDGKRRMGC